LDDFGPIALNSSFLPNFVPLLAKSVQISFIQVMVMDSQTSFLNSPHSFLFSINIVLSMNDCQPLPQNISAVFGAILSFNRRPIPRAPTFIIRPLISNRMVLQSFYLLKYTNAFHFPGNVCNESAAIFERTGSRSLIISGASRFAVNRFVQLCILGKYYLVSFLDRTTSLSHHVSPQIQLLTRHITMAPCSILCVLQ
jgi:hypothetical protein